eukprot:TRINITY_DN39350_c0_g1_i1.p1 TRINITY_DN39350_c0_g1~~TRINITY_DN39350_c0_g1_i1.p1  ORF type:complete len:190 (+),score=39.65 TRINITY_DN39350_c0_g1_i1:77-571(+)
MMQRKVPAKAVDETAPSMPEATTAVGSQEASSAARATTSEEARDHVGDQATIATTNASLKRAVDEFVDWALPMLVNVLIAMVIVALLASSGLADMIGLTLSTAKPTEQSEQGIYDAPSMQQDLRVLVSVGLGVVCCYVCLGDEKLGGETLEADNRRSQFVALSL